MGDMGDIGRAMTENRKERHSNWKLENIGRIVGSGIPYQSVNFGDCLLFREHGRPVVDFYPSTGRWRTPGIKRTFSGGAGAFLTWYSANTNPTSPPPKARHD